MTDLNTLIDYGLSDALRILSDADDAWERARGNPNSTDHEMDDLARHVSRCQSDVDCARFRRAQR